MERVSDLISIDALSQNSISTSTINSQSNNINSSTLTRDIDSFCSLEGILENALIDLKKVINEKIFTTWFNDLKLIGIEPIFSDKEDLLSITLGCPNKFSQEHLKHQYSKEIEDSFKKITGSKVSIKIENLNTSSFETAQKNPVKKEQTSNQTYAQKSFANLNLTKKSAQSPNNESNLNTSYNFSNFVVGSCNQFAQAASIKVSETPGKSYNPLLIYGGVGLGKTHLVQAIGNKIKQLEAPR
jgi:chromosomal replication initiator protein